MIVDKTMQELVEAEVKRLAAVKEFVNAPERGLHYNRIDGVNGLKEVNSELLEFTLTDEEVSLIDESTEIKPFDVDGYNSKIAESQFRLEREKLIEKGLVKISTGKTFSTRQRSLDALNHQVTAYLSEPDDTIILFSTEDVGTGVMVECTKSEIKEAYKAVVDFITSVWDRTE